MTSAARLVCQYGMMAIGLPVAWTKTNTTKCTIAKGERTTVLHCHIVTERLTGPGDTQDQATNVIKCQQHHDVQLVKEDYFTMSG